MNTPARRPIILFVTYGWNETGGGTVYPRSVALELAGRGYDIAVFYAALDDDPAHPPYLLTERRENGIRLFGLSNRPALFIDADNPEREINDPLVVERFCRVLDSVSPDLIHFHNFHGLTFALAEEAHRRNIPSCFTPHNYHLIDPELYLLKNGLEQWNGIDPIVHSEAVARNPHKRAAYLQRVVTTHRLVHEWVTVTLAVSQRQKELLSVYGADSSRIAVVHQASPVADRLWHDQTIAAAGTRPVALPLRVGFIGGVLPIKGVHMLVAAAQAFTGDQLQIHIHGFIQNDYVEQLIALDRKSLVVFHGTYGPTDLSTIAATLDLAVLPSVVEESAPTLVLSELQAMRLPVIAARIGGIPEFITDGVDGLLYRHDALEELVAVLQRCVAQPELVQQMRSNLDGPTHTFSRYMEHLEQLYLRLQGNDVIDAGACSLLAHRRKQSGDANLPSICWQGGLFVHHSLSLVNRELCLQLITQGHALFFHSTEPDEFNAGSDPRFKPLDACRTSIPEHVDVTVRHHWPPDFSPVADGKLVVIQPWEYGSIPKAWVDPINGAVDELWVPSSFVRECYIQGGVRAEKVHVVPNGVDTDRFTPGTPPRPLATRKSFRFLFAGGTIHRKGIDLLLAAYAAEFSATDDICLVIKDMGGNGIYQGQTAVEMIRSFQACPHHPEVLYLDDMLDDREMAGLYAACHCLVHPYRGEGFGLPIAEAMACGLPVIVTGYGAALDFCNDSNAWLIPGRLEPLGKKMVGNLETVDYPWFAEPDLAELQRHMRHVFLRRDEAQQRGRAGRATIEHGFTWQRAGAVAAGRLKALVNAHPYQEAVIEVQEAHQHNDAEPQTLPQSEDDIRRRFVTNAIAEARRLALRQEYDQAIAELLEKGIRLAPEEYAPYRALLELLVSVKRFQDALDVVRELPENAGAAAVLSWRAVCLAGLGEDTVARQAAEAALMLAPDDARAHNALGILACRQGNAREAEQHFRKAGTADPAFHESFANRGVLAWAEGAHGEAFELLAQSVRLSPLDGDILAMLKSAAIGLDRQPEEEQVLRAALLGFPESRAVLIALIDNLGRQDRLSEALPVLEQALALFEADNDLLEMALDARSRVGLKTVGAGNGSGVSLCMIIKNEAHCLARCLYSVARLVDELVIVDTGSTDRSVEIATAFGARIFNFTWTGNFSDARNVALSQAQGAWILCMDADETLSKKDEEAFRRMLRSSSPAKDAWSVLIRNYSRRVNIQGWTPNDGAYPDEEQADGWYPAVRVRLFPNDRRIRFSGAVHELVEPALRQHGFVIHDAPMVAHHYGELHGMPDNLQGKQLRYFELGKQKLAAQPDDVVALTELAVQAAELGLYSEALELWERVLVLRPDTVEALFNKGYVLMELKRYHLALEASRKALQLDPAHREAAFNYGTCELYAGEPGRALPVVEQLLKQDGRHPLLAALMVVLCLAEGQIEKARAAHRLLTSLEYGIDDYIHARTAMLIQLGRNDLSALIKMNAADMITRVRL